MKKLLIVTLLVGMMSGCLNRANTSNIQKSKTANVSWEIESGYVETESFNTIKIEGCEYLVSHYDRSRSITHKGNCCNPIHNQNNK